MPLALAALIDLDINDAPGFRFVICSGDGTKTFFSSYESSFITLVSFRFLRLVNVPYQI